MSRPLFDQRFILGADRDEVEQLQQAVLAAAEQLGYDRTSCFAIRLALEEALSNAFKHGNRSDPGKTVTVEYRVGPQHLHLAVEDQGPGFDPGAVPDPTHEENVEIPCGRGITLMRAFMSEVRFAPPGNRVEMVFRREA